MGNEGEAIRARMREVHCGSSCIHHADNVRCADKAADVALALLRERDEQHRVALFDQVIDRQDADVAASAARNERDAARAELASLRQQVAVLGADIIALGRDWRAGRVANIGPRITALHLRAAALSEPVPEGESE